MEREKYEMVEDRKDETLEMLRRELKITRYCSLFVAVLLIGVIIGGGYMLSKVTPALQVIEQMQPAIAKMEQLDVEMFNAKIEQLDIEGLNKAIGELDAQEVSEALKNINEAVEKLKEAEETFGVFSETFKNSLSGWFGLGNSSNP